MSKARSPCHTGITIFDGFGHLMRKHRDNLAPNHILSMGEHWLCEVQASMHRHLGLDNTVCVVDSYDVTAALATCPVAAMFSHMRAGYYQIYSDGVAV